MRNFCVTAADLAILLTGVRNIFSNRRRVQPVRADPDTHGRCPMLIANPAPRAPPIPTHCAA